MKALVSVLSVLSLAGAFAVGRLTAPVLAPEGARQPISLLWQALEDENLLTRSYNFSLFLQGLAPDNVAEAIEVLEARRVGVTEYELQVFMLAWASFDAPAAFEWASSYPSRWRRSLMRSAMYAWGFHDPQQAAVALETFTSSRDRQLLFDALITAWTRGEDQAGASEFIASQASSKQRGKAVQALAAMIGKDGEGAVIEWADAVPEDAPGDYKLLVFGTSSGVVAKADPKRAASWYQAHRGKAYAEGALDGIARRWALHHDAAELFEWLRGLDGAEDRAEGMHAGFQSWLGKNPEEAAAWLDTAGPLPEVDRAIRSFVRKSRSRPASAIEWAGRIQDPKTRDRSLVLAAQAWLRRDPEAARAWLATSGLDEAAKQEILDPSQAARSGPSGGRALQRAGREPRKGPRDASVP